jgi:tRNA threonylcarbamoyladenosine biosynthesis protein TsaE
MIFSSQSPEDTFSFGREFAERLIPGDVIGLAGELGSGKTQFVKGICSYFNIQDIVNSPTFIIVNNYEGKYKGREITINHFDLYRLKTTEELKNIGFENFLESNSLNLIEWYGISESIIGNKLRKVNLYHGKTENERMIEIVE